MDTTTPTIPDQPILMQITIPDSFALGADLCDQFAESRKENRWEVLRENLSDLVDALIHIHCPHCISTETGRLLVSTGYRPAVPLNGAMTDPTSSDEYLTYLKYFS